MPLYFIFCFGVEFLLISTAVLLAAILRFSPGSSVLESLLPCVPHALLIASVCQLCMYYTELYDFKIAFNNSRLFIKLSQALAVATVVLAVFFYMAPSLVVGRGVLLSGLVLTFCFVVAWRMLYQGLLSMRQFRVKVLIIGTGEEARKLAGEVLSKQPFGYELRGFVGEDNEVGRDVM